MDYLVSILAAVGGLVAGAGFGAALTRRNVPPPVDERLRLMTHRLREKVTPVLERRAEVLGITLPPRTKLKVSDERGLVELDGDEVERLVALAGAIAARDEADSVALSDTVQLSKDDLKPIRDSGRPAPAAKAAVKTGP